MSLNPTNQPNLFRWIAIIQYRLTSEMLQAAIETWLTLRQSDIFSTWVNLAKILLTKKIEKKIIITLNLKKDRGNFFFLKGCILLGFRQKIEPEQTIKIQVRIDWIMKSKEKTMNLNEYYFLCSFEDAVQ